MWWKLRALICRQMRYWQKLNIILLVNDSEPQVYGHYLPNKCSKQELNFLKKNAKVRHKISLNAPKWRRTNF